MTKQETFQATQCLQLETSYGVLRKQNDVELDVSVRVNDSDQYGSFEIYDIETGGEDWYAEGGLWFEGNKVVDYDGVFSLPIPVINKLKEWGYDVSEVE